MGVLKLFWTELCPQRNAMVEDIDRFLDFESERQFTINYIQYQKIALNIDVTVPLDQNAVGTFSFNYACLEQDNRKYYFFLGTPRWASRGTVTIPMALDTLVTYWNDLNWSDRTSIIREHRDRYKRSVTGNIIRNIDFWDEGLAPVKNHKVVDDRIGDAGKWFIAYTANNQLTPENTTDPIRLLVLHDSVEVLRQARSGGAAKTLTASSSRLGRFYFLSGTSLANPTITGTGFSNIVINSETDSSGGLLRAVRLICQKHPNKYQWRIFKLFYTGNSYPYSFSSVDEIDATDNTSIVINNFDKLHESDNTPFYSSLNDLTIIDGLDGTVYNSGTIPQLTSVTFSNFDRGNSRISKIIEIPSRPMTFVDYNALPIDYGYRNRYIVLDDSSLMNTLGTININEISFSISPRKHDLSIDVNRESKLFSSEFYDYRFVYDNDNKQIKLENLYQVRDNPVINLSQYISNDMSGNKLFKFDFDDAQYMSETDFDNVLISTRNTEKPIYTSGYMDYIKNGYNYDQEAMRRQNLMAGIGAAVNLASGVVSIAGGAAGLAMKAAAQPDSMAVLTSGLLGNPEAKKTDLRPLELSFATSLMSQGLSHSASLFSTIGSIDAANKRFSQSMRERMASAPSINGQASTDLMDIYCEGKMRIIKKTPRDEVRENVAKLFKLTGYSHPVQEVPDFTSRLYFNFVQCDPVFINERTSVYSDYLEDIKARFRMGVTVFHNVDGEWDMNQVYENWETSVM